MNKNIRKAVIGCAVFCSMMANFPASFAGSESATLERKALKSGQKLTEGKIEAVVTDGISPEKIMSSEHRLNYLFRDLVLDEKSNDYSTAFVYDDKKNVYVIVFDYRKNEERSELRKIAINGSDYGIVYEIFNELVLKEHFAGKHMKKSTDKEVIQREKIKPFEELFKGFQKLKIEEKTEREQEE